MRLPSDDTVLTRSMILGRSLLEVCRSLICASSRVSYWSIMVCLAVYPPLRTNSGASGPSIILYEREWRAYSSRYSSLCSSINIPFMMSSSKGFMCGTISSFLMVYIPETSRLSTRKPSSLSLVRADISRLGISLLFIKTKV